MKNFKIGENGFNTLKQKVKLSRKSESRSRVRICDAFFEKFDRMKLSKMNFVATSIGILLPITYVATVLMKTPAVDKLEDKVALTPITIQSEDVPLEEEDKTEELEITESFDSVVTSNKSTVRDPMDYSDLQYIDGVWYFYPPTLQQEESSVVAQEKKLAALTFDDGPTKLTTELLDLLDEYQIKATFFVIGENIDKNKEAIIDAYQRGHEIGVHTYHHIDLTTVSMEKAKNEIEETIQKLNSIGIDSVSLVRPPYGHVSEEMLENLDYPMITWNVDVKDWATEKPWKVRTAILNDIFDNAILLLHDGRESTIEGLRNVLPLLDGEYQFVTVSTLFQENEVEIETGKKYRYVK